nr:transmembrane protein-related protein [Tanacetum cinerariifolium]
GFAKYLEMVHLDQLELSNKSTGSGATIIGTGESTLGVSIGPKPDWTGQDRPDRDLIGQKRQTKDLTKMVWSGPGMEFCWGNMACWCKVLCKRKTSLRKDLSLPFESCCLPVTDKGSSRSSNVLLKPLLINSSLGQSQT